MGYLNFPSHFINLFMECVSTPKSSLIFYGNLHGYFASKRGLRKGDPVSTLLFEISMEYLSRILKNLEVLEGFSYDPRCMAMKLTRTFML